MSADVSKTYKLANGSGSWIEVLPFGASLIKVVVPDAQGQMGNCILSYSDMERYRQNPFFFGSTAGRCANRIAFGKFSVDGLEVSLPCNEGQHHLHGGSPGFSHRPWHVEDFNQGQEEASIALSLVSEDGDQGYPGIATVYQTIRFDSENRITIDYRGKTTKPTPLNLTNHSYFNLSGNSMETVADHLLTIPSQKYLSVDDTMIPNNTMAVSKSPFDFTAAKTIDSCLTSQHGQLEIADGLDHCYLFEDSPSPALLAELIHRKSGRRMCVWSTKPALQVYTGNRLSTKDFPKHSGICLETQYPPNFANERQFQRYVLRPGEEYHHQTIFAFSTLNLI